MSTFAQDNDVISDPWGRSDQSITDIQDPWNQSAGPGPGSNWVPPLDDGIQNPWPYHPPQVVENKGGGV